MNRAEYRRQKHQKNPTYNFTEKQIVEYVQPIIDKAKNDAIYETILRLTCVIAQSLNDEYGFGRERINRLLERAMYKFDCINDGLVTLDEIQKWCEETGINIGGE